MFTGLAIITGFILMSGGDTGDETSFNPEIFNFQRITLAPILILTGFVIEVLQSQKNKKNKFNGLLEAIILGIVQGSEFLPVSSSGHIEIAKALLGTSKQEQNLLMTIVLIRLLH